MSKKNISSAKSGNKPRNSQSDQLKTERVRSIDMHHPLLLFGIAGLLFTVLFARYWNFVMDDAFIIFRYAENVALHGQLTWNLGEDPVEGFTSFAWVMLNAMAIRVGWDPVLFSKVMSWGSVMVVLWLLARTGRESTFPIRIAVMAALGASPAFALLAAQSLATSFTTMLLVVSTLQSLSVIRSGRLRAMMGWYALVFLAALTRPDTVVFHVGVGLGMIVCLWKDRAVLMRLLLASLPFFIVGLLFMGWRYSYFGYLLPNPAYIKLGQGLALRYVGTFLLFVMLPYLVLGGFALWVGRRRTDLMETVPVLLGVALFGAYLLTIMPHQGYLWRYGFPIMGPLLVLLLRWTSSPQPFAWSSLSKFVKVGIALFFIAWPFLHLRSADLRTHFSSSAERVLVGKALAGLGGTMYTSESGAPAYHSRWNVVDDLGLNSEAIAHGESRITVLEELEPDLVMLHIGKRFNRDQYPEVAVYLEKQHYEAIALIHKAGSVYHLFFVRPDSELRTEIIERLCAMEHFDYGDLDQALADEPVLLALSNKGNSPR